jgi:hypothetical protein
VASKMKDLCWYRYHIYEIAGQDCGQGGAME